MKNLISMLMLGISAVVFGEATVTVTSIKQNWPWDAKTTVNYTLVGDEDGRYDVSLKIKRGFDVYVPESGALRGDLKSVRPGNRSVEWNPQVDGITDVLRFTEESFSLEVTEAPVTATSSAKEYLVLDLSAGADAGSWPVAAVDGIDLSDEQYKTTKLVLKRVRAGTFLQSSPEDEPLRKAAYESQSEVRLTNDYWIGVYELTAKQHELITGEACPEGEEACPLRSVPYSEVRGAHVGALWPGSSDVDAGSLIGILRSKATFPDTVPAGWKFDLPTEAQWEYACRAGSGTVWNDGTGLNVITNDAGAVFDPNLDRLGWYAANSGGTPHKVGLKHPNGFGLYDMHGNVWEMTLGIIHTRGNPPQSGIEPPGFPYGNNPDGVNSYRVVRGGCYRNGAPTYYEDGLPETAIAMCRTAARCRIYSGANNNVGLRLVVRFSSDNAGHDLEKYPSAEYPYH